VLGGRDKDRALLKQPDVRALAAGAPDLVTCVAVRADSDEVCNLLDKAAAESCRSTRALFHELRAYPNGRSYMFDERRYRECKQPGGMPAAVCDALQKALRSGDANQCVVHADFEAMCREAARAGTLASEIDASQCGREAPRLKSMLEGECRAMVNLDESACDIPGPRREEMAKQCRAEIDAGKRYGKGLQELAKSGSPRDQDLAKAALNDPKACEALTKRAVDDCVAPTSAPPVTTIPTEMPNTPTSSPGGTSPPTQ
jgi:hypothetical protein